jgi:hypothetical protein
MLLEGGRENRRRQRAEIEGRFGTQILKSRFQLA